MMEGESELTQLKIYYSRENGMIITLKFDFYLENLL